MRWTGNPFFHPKPKPPPSSPPAATASDEESALPPSEPSSQDEPPTPILLRPTPTFTPHQIFYIFILDSLGAALLSGAINFAVAYAMYTTQDTALNPIRLFQLPNTLAGDAGVTIILQNIITWLIELVLVNRDLAKGAIAPIGFIPQPEGKWARWFMFLDRKEEAERPGGRGHWVSFMFSQVVRAFIVAVACFVLFWGPSVGILTAVGTRSGGDWVFEQKWAPQIFKFVLGAVLGLVTTPAFVVFWLVRAGWALQTNGGAVMPG
ncbi:hypothetical protein QBC34DRAFT_174345 [Podospora aff. communis PSN243]|uniref:Uncharacterized protein n=1 Tax=Podospora aff. communis PSN243 TaxID=3040156 RepID=A0AAV9H4S8_9PEZI|nr:hypothetical protein QBC34DRAFT_174345 [Podospora aff. communis PSN243]